MVTFRVCKSVRLLELLVVTRYKRSINPIINPNVAVKWLFLSCFFVFMMARFESFSSEYPVVSAEDFCGSYQFP
jgi:hypothetical protein